MRARFGLDQVAWESKAGLAALSNFDFRAVSVAATYRFLLAVSALSLSRSLFFFLFSFIVFSVKREGERHLAAARERGLAGGRERARRREGSGLPACGREVVFSLLFLSLFFSDFIVFFGERESHLAGERQRPRRRERAGFADARVRDVGRRGGSTHRRVFFF